MATYAMYEGKEIPAIIFSFPALALWFCDSCKNVMYWIINHELGHIVNGDIDLEIDPGYKYEIPDYEERVRGEIPEREFKADRFSWDTCSEEQKEGVKKEIPYLLALFEAVYGTKKSTRKFKIRAQALGFEIGSTTNEGLEVLEKEYNEARERIVETNYEELKALGLVS